MIDPTDERTTDLFDGVPDDLPSAAEALASDPGRWPRQMADITDVLEHELTRLDRPLEPLAARRLACRLVARICRDCGGTWMYLPKGDSLERVLRNAWLWGEYDGTTDGPGGVNTLAKRVGMTSIAVYRILAEQRALHRKAVQPDLFEAREANL